MRFVKQALWMALVFAGLMAANIARGEDAALVSYRDTLYALFQERGCVRCHDGQQRFEVWGPSFAHTDIDKSYRQVLKYIRFDNIEQSYLVTKGGGGHWLADYGYDCKTTEKDLAGVIRKWAEKLENGGVRPAVRTASVALAANLPEKRDEFVKMEWDVSDLVSKRKAVLELEVQRLRAPAGVIPGAYAFRRPRLRIDKGAIEVKGLSILINGKANPWRNRFQEIERKVEATAKAPLLSPEVEIVKQDKAAGDEVQIQFQVLTAAEGSPCPDLDGFKKTIVPIYKIRNCAQCHRADGLAFAFSDDEEALCRETAQHLNLKGRLERSPWLGAAGRGQFGHPIVFTEEDYTEVLERLRAWLKTQ